MNNIPPSIDPVSKRTNGGVAICFSACEDCQMAADTAVRIILDIILICSCNAIQWTYFFTSFVF